ncbi:MAG: amino acid adenylation domain-containing protein [Pseudomonadota bacterium]
MSDLNFDGVSLNDFIDACIARDISFALDGDKLRVFGQGEALSAPVLAAIRERKAELTAWLIEQEAQRGNVAAPIVPADRAANRFPLSFSQQRVWFIDRMEGESAHYNMPGAFRIRGEFSEDLAQQALAAVIARHEVLRAQFHDSPEGPYQSIRDDVAFAMARHDLSAMDPAAREAALQAAVDEDARRPFKLATDLLLRAAFLRLSADEGMLLLNMHHIASDGWSVGVLVKEFARNYEALRNGVADPLPALAIQYVDYAAWQRSPEQAAHIERQVAHWKEVLTDCPRIHGLPLDKPRPPQQNFKARSFEAHLDASLADRLNTLAREQDATLFMLLQSAFALLLSRWSGEQDIMLAVPVAGRSRTELDPLIGFFINTLVFRTDLSGQPTFSELLRQAKEYALDAYSHQDVPFELLVDALRPERDLSYNPLCQVKFLLQNHEAQNFAMPGMELEAVACADEYIRFDLDLTISETARGGLFLKWTYKEDLFNRATIERLSAAYACLLGAVVAAPASPVAQLALLDDAALATWMAQACGAEQPAGRDTSVVSKFEQAAAAAGSAVALRHGSVSMTFDQLNAKANRLAHYLIEQGVEAGQRVGIYVERSPELMVAILGVLKCGAAYVPFEPKNTRERLGRIITDAGIEWVLAQPGMADRLPSGGIDLMMLDAAGGEGWLAEYPSHNPGLDIPLAHSAYVIYTSGSTGAPKGVEITHAGLADYCEYASGRYYETGLAGSLVVTSHGFDITVPSLFLPLLRGGAVRFLEAGDELTDLAARLANPATAPALLRMTPMHVRGLLELLPAGATVATRHVFVVGGEAFTVSLARELQARFAGSQLYNHYGPTETVVGCAMFDISANIDALERVLPIGRPMDNTRLYVLNGALQPCPAGVAGELHIGGLGVAKGYLNQPQLTAEKFIADPFVPAQRLYKTGDLVLKSAAGDLEFIARIDDQVKLRGYRIELGEIRAALLSQDLVREALVVVTGDGEHKRLAAYIVAAAPIGDEAAFFNAVQARLKEALPDYMVPAAYVALDAMPLSANGKIDVRALPAITAGVAGGFVAPRSQTESVLCAIWQQLLKVEQVGVHDNFFALGGDSILSIQVVARANLAGLGITTRQLFAHQTVAELALHAGAARHEANQQPAEGAIALLPVQRQFLAHDIHNAHYNQSVLLEAPAGLDAGMLGQIMAALYRRHDGLRMTVALTDGQWQASHAPLTAHMLDASVMCDTLPAEGQADYIATRCAEVQRSFDPASGPLLRALLLQAAPGQQGARLFLAAHHLVVDGVSWRILLADMEQAYGQLCSGEPVALAAKTSSFQQWSAAVSGYAASTKLEAQLPYWLAQLNLPVSSLPQQSINAPQSSTRSVRFALLAEETAALLKNCSQRYRTQINELLLAGVYLGMRAWSGAEGMRLTLEGHGREDLFDALDTSQTVGWFTTTYPVALACTGADTGAVIRQVKEQLRAVPQRGFGYGVLRHLAADNGLAAAELASPAQLMFNYLGQFDQSVGGDNALRAATEATGDAIDPRRLRHCPLGLNGKVAGGVLDFTLDYSALQFERAQIERLAALMAQGLRAVIDHCADAAPGQFTPSDFPLAQVSALELDQWQRQYKIGKLYPATSMQQGMLFHSMLDSGAYVTQTYPVLSGELDMACFRAAWDAMTVRHDIFRTVFVGQGEHLHQLVVEHASLPWTEHDWRALDPVQQAARFDQLRLDDRARGFDFAHAPLQRISMFRLSDTRYQMLWTHHHMLLDGWCTPLVYRDVMDAYRRLRSGRALDTSPVPLYQSYIGWLAQQDRGQARQYWHDYLDGVEGPTALRLARPDAGDDGEQRVMLDAGDTARLQQFARQHHTTVNTVFQLAWGYLLHCYSGEQDVMFGTTISGRPAELEGVEEMVGLFINTIPVRVSFGQSRQVGALLDSLHQAFQSSTSYGYLPLTEIIQCSAVSGGSNLFDSLVVFENYPLDAALEEDQKAEVHMEALGSFIANGYGITLNVNSGPSTRISCCYSGKMLDGGTARALLGHLKTVLLAMAGGAASIDAVCLLEGEERQRMLVEWNATERAWPDQRPVHAQFEDSAAAHGAAIALRHGSISMTYEQLNAKANRLAHYLVEQGVGPGQRIGIYVERSLELMVAILGVLKSGAAYVPFEPKNTRERLGRIIADAGIEWVLAQPGMADRLPSGGIDLMMLDDAGGEGWLHEYPSHNPNVAVRLDDSAYVIYTSGSTGAPKGVEIAHGGLMDYCSYASGRYYAAGLAGALVVTSHGFDITVPSLYLPLLHGGVVEFLAAGDEVSDLAAHLARPDCPPCLLRMTPMHVRGLLELLPPAALVMGRHVFVVGGEAFTVSLARELQQRCPGSQLFNHYGPTETVVGCAMFDISANIDTLGRVLPIGRPMANTRLYVLDGALQPCPPGVAGELHIGGAGVAKGYLNQPQLTAAKFIDDPFVPGQRLYKTGDLVRFLAGGDIEFIARVDDQVKLRGYRIELGEIRAALLALDEVHEAVVLVAGEGEDKRLTACLVASAHVDDEAGFVHAVQSRLKQALPDYMVPSAFALLPHLPLTANGKIDQRSLLTLAGLLAPQQSYVAPATATEKHLAQIWQALLNGEPVSATANFFDIGGHSLLAMRLINAIQTEFGIACSLKALLANPSIVAMAEQIDLSVLKASNQEGANSNENNIETEW